MTDPIQRDLERLGRAFGRPPGLPVPGQPRQAPTAGEPRTPGEFFARLPQEVAETGQAGLELLAQAPGQVLEDLTTVATNLARLPREVAREAFLTPGQLAQRLAPSNINAALSTVRDSSEFRGLDTRMMREKMRTITDVIDLFTPT